MNTLQDSLNNGDILGIRLRKIPEKSKNLWTMEKFPKGKKKESPCLTQVREVGWADCRTERHRLQSRTGPYKKG